MQFDLSFPQASRPFLVTLRDDVPNPFVPKPAPLHRDHKREDDEEAGKKSDKVARIDIDFEGIGGRILGFPIDEGNYEQIVAARGRALFTQFPSRGIKPAGNTWEDEDETGTLLAYDFEQQRLATLAQDVGKIRLGADHRTLIYTSHERLRAIDALGDLPEESQDEPKPPSDPGRRSGWLDLSRASVLVEPRDEWAQMYYEAWRMQREQFWDAAVAQRTAQ